MVWFSPHRFLTQELISGLVQSALIQLIATLGCEIVCIINAKAMDYLHRMMRRLRWVFSLAHSALDSGAKRCG